MRKWLLTWLALTLGATAHAAKTTDYDVIFAGVVSGKQTTRVTDDGRIQSSLSYRNNGRGPDYQSTIALAPDGTIASYSLTGTSTYGAKVDEQFTRKGDQVSWESPADRGQRVATDAVMYVPVESTFEYGAVLARALLAAPGRSLPGLPAGELGIEKLHSLTVQAGAETLPVALFAIRGQSITPDYVWLVDDAAHELFAVVEPGYFRLIQSAWLKSADELEAIQKKAEDALLSDLATRLAHRLGDSIVIRNVRVFDSESAKLGEPQDVFVFRGRIAALYPTRSTHSGAPIASIDGAGRVLLPGLFDMHVHGGNWDALMNLAGGATSVRDMGADNAFMQQLIDRIAAGQVLGPRILPAGFIEGESPFSARGGYVVKSEAEAIAAVDWYAQHGYRQIKIYNSFNPAWVAPTAKYAHERGLRVSGHIPAFMKADAAVRAGYDEIQHINQTLLSFFTDEKTDTRTLARFYLVAEKAGGLDLDSPPVQQYMELLKTSGTTLDVTLATFEAFFLQPAGAPNPTFEMVTEHVPSSLARQWATNESEIPPDKIERYRKSYATLLDFTGRAWHAGIPIVAGTDNIGGFTLPRELELYVKAGIPPAEVLKIATWNGAKYTGTLGDLGSIERGKSADLILVDGDPTTNISDIRRVSLVMKEGVVYYPAELWAAVGVRPFAAPPVVTVP